MRLCSNCPNSLCEFILRRDDLPQLPKDLQTSRIKPIIPSISPTKRSIIHTANDPFLYYRTNMEYSTMRRNHMSAVHYRTLSFAHDIHGMPLHFVYEDIWDLTSVDEIFCVARLLSLSLYVSRYCGCQGSGRFVKSTRGRGMHILCQTMFVLATVGSGGRVMGLHNGAVILV